MLSSYNKQLKRDPSINILWNFYKRMLISSDVKNTQALFFKLKSLLDILLVISNNHI